MSLNTRVQKKRGRDCVTRVSRVEFIPKLMLNAERGSEEVHAVLRGPRALWTIEEWAQIVRQLDQEYSTSDLFHIHVPYVCLTVVYSFVLCYLTHAILPSWRVWRTSF